MKGVWERYPTRLTRIGPPFELADPARSYEFPRAASRPVRSTDAPSAGNKTPILRAPSLSFNSTGLWRWYVTHYLPFLDSVRRVIFEALRFGSGLWFHLQARRTPTICKGSHSIGVFFARRRKKSPLPKRRTSTITRCTKSPPPSANRSCQPVSSGSFRITNVIVLAFFVYPTL
jgi:hypothetical protein